MRACALVSEPARAANESHSSSCPPLKSASADALLSRACLPFLSLIFRTKSIEGVTIEDNKFCCSVHFRNCSPESIEDIEAIVKDVVDSKGLQMKQGRKVFEVRPQVRKVFRTQRACPPASALLRFDSPPWPPAHLPRFLLLTHVTSLPLAPPRHAR